MSELLDYDTLETLIKKADDAELWESDKRRLLFFRIGDLRGRVPRATSDSLQLRGDLQFLNASAERDGLHPLLMWLQNSRPLVADRDEQDFFEKLVSRLEGRAGDSAGMTSARLADVAAALKKEAILVQDDMLPIGYLQAGMQAARSVARLRVPRYEGGQEQEKRYWGTGWLLTDSLLMTNHHVFNAREDEEQNASADDFRDQALHTTVQFDVDFANGGSEPVSIIDVVTIDEKLDYAVVRIAPPGRPALSVERAPFSLKPGEVVPLNIIQHPGGQPKKIAIRNNLATAAVSPELRYFTSTLGGSSGAPVFNDKWRVVGIHRGSIGTKTLNFQGRTTAIVNLGTAMAAILAQLPESVRAGLL
jgi:V8-like Glu-specific endopeptidase